MRHAASVRYFDFTSMMIIALASVVGARYLIGTGDTDLNGPQQSRGPFNF